jgi:hypothetical protein
VPGTGITLTWSVRGSTWHRSLGRPSPSTSPSAAAAPIAETHAEIRSMLGWTSRASRTGAAGPGNSKRVNWKRAARADISSAAGSCGRDMS